MLVWENLVTKSLKNLVILDSYVHRHLQIMNMGLRKLQHESCAVELDTIWDTSQTLSITIIHMDSIEELYMTLYIKITYIGDVQCHYYNPNNKMSQTCGLQYMRIITYS